MMRDKGKSRGRTARVVTRRDPVKEARVATLVADLVARGLVVRREELRRGLGWRAVSGVCRVFDRETVFVDRRLGVDEQISFLEAKLASISDEVAIDPPNASSGEEKDSPFSEGLREELS